MMTTNAVRRPTGAAAQALARVTEGAMARHHVPGVAVGIWHGGEELLAGYGITSVENPLGVTADTLFQIGSITKTFTATLAMRLVEQGKLDLDAPLRTYLPDLRLRDEAVAAAVTLRHCFAHVGGWVGDYFADFGRGDDALARVVAAMADLPQLTPLGEVWSYNNAAFYLAGRAIEVVTGQTYEQAMQELVFDPLGMDMSFFFADDAISRRVVAGHNVFPEGPLVVRPWALRRAAHAAGAISSTVRDMLKYARFHLSGGVAADGSRLLGRESVEHMQARYVEAGSLTQAVGVSWMLDDVGGVRIVSHGGSTTGQRASFRLAPERDFAVCVLTNADRGTEVFREVSAWALRHFLGVESAEPTVVPMDAASLGEFAGRYTAALSEVELSAAENGLILQARSKGGLVAAQPVPPPPPAVRLSFTGPDRVVCLETPFTGNRGEFLRHPDGSIAWFRWGGRICRREA